MQKISLLASEITEVKFEFRSKGLDEIYDSRFTAAARDMQVGISDMAIGPYYINSEGLDMVNSSRIVGSERIMIVGKMNVRVNRLDFTSQVLTVFMPFETSLWLCLIVVILLLAGLSLLFTNPHATNERPWKAFWNNE